MKNARQQIPEPKLTPPQPLAVADGNALGAHALQQSATDALAAKQYTPPKVSIAVNGMIELRNPKIELSYYLPVWAGQKKQVSPKRALIVGSAIVIEELNMILPLEGAVIHTE